MGILVVTILIVATAVVVASCTGAIFKAIEAAMDRRNPQPATPLTSRMIHIFREFFPELDLAAVRVKWESNFIGGGYRTGMTFGNKIFLRYSRDSCNWKTMVWLLHELVHVQQYARDGYPGFACKYPWQALLAGFKYRSIGYEEEAYSVSEDPQKRAHLSESIAEFCDLARSRRISDSLFLGSATSSHLSLTL